jgi:hypothetical protein
MFTTKTGKITQVTICAENFTDTSNYGMGLMYIFMNELPPAPGNDYRCVAVMSNHPAFSEILQVAIGAQARAATVELTYLDSHNIKSNAWDFGVLNQLA